MLDKTNVEILPPETIITTDVINCDNNNKSIYHSNKLQSHLIYFANELALHTEIIGHPYSNEFKTRELNFKKEINLFAQIGRDLLDGNVTSFKHLSRYYVHPSKYKEYTREYMLNKWVTQKINHINPDDLIGAHPSCPQYKNDNKHSIETHELYFTHKCCVKNGPPHARSAIELGKFDNVYHYTYPNISEKFMERNQRIVSYWRGAGYWLWKPWIILNTMINIGKPCDIVCYCDAGAWWNNTAQPLFDITSKVKYGIMVFSHLLSNWGKPNDPKSVNLTERLWSKRDAFLLLGVDIKEMYDTVIRKATFSCYQTNPDSIHFVNEWLYHAMDERIISDNPNSFNIKNIPYFEDNRHDQTIMSLLSKKYGIPAFLDVSQYGYNDVRAYGKHIVNWDFPWIIKHTRGKQ